MANWNSEIVGRVALTVVCVGTWSANHDADRPVSAFAARKALQDPKKEAFKVQQSLKDGSNGRYKEISPRPTRTQDQINRNSLKKRREAILSSLTSEAPLSEESLRTNAKETNTDDFLSEFPESSILLEPLSDIFSPHIDEVSVGSIHEIGDNK